MGKIKAKSYILEKHFEGVPNKDNFKIIENDLPPIENGVNCYWRMVKIKAKSYIFEKHFEGVPKKDDFRLVENDLPPIKNGEFLAEAIYFSLDPGTRAYSSQMKLRETFPGFQVARIIDSKNPRHPVGQHIMAYFGWRTYTISDGNTLYGKVMVLPDFGGLPLSLALGALGITGNTAYFGFLEICTPRVGETVVVTAAAGATGNHVGQIAKIKGCKVIGIAGSDEKGKWLVDELGFDHFINYKTADVDKALTDIAPQGIDCYFDNVGGELSSIILKHMNQFGRISVCGAISGYNNTEIPKASSVQWLFVASQLKIEGFVVTRWKDRWNEGVQQNLKWIKEGKLKYKETVTEGFENLPTAFSSLFRGENIGKSIVKV